MIVDLFAGPGGWSEGLRMLDLTDLGIEWDAAACATRAAAGHLTIRADIATYPPERFAGAEGLIASPPCPDWSIAGKGARRAGTSGHLVDIVPEWVDAIRPSWVACEQVPPVLEVWHEHAALYRTWGYSTWAGILNAADYGVPQTRRRAILLARLDGPALPPEPTHCQGGAVTMFGTLEPWVSMADALGWGLPAEPSPVLMTARNRQTGHDVLRGSSWRQEWFRRQQKAGNWVLTERQAHGVSRSVDEPAMTITASADNGNFRWVHEHPATTLTTDERVFGPHAGSAGESQSENTIRLTLAEALTLQSFPPGYPVQGTKTAQFRQVGDAVPPLLAAHVLAAVTGRALDLEAAA